MTSALYAPYLPPLDADPARVSAAASRFADVAEQIQTIADSLNALADEEYSIGQAADQFRTSARDVASSVLAAVPRYSTTASALSEFAVVLASAQSEADDAIGILNQAVSDARPLYTELDQARLEADALATREEAAPAWATNAVDRLEEDIAGYERTIDAAIAQHQQAFDDFERAAHHAADLIEPVLDALNDSFWDDWNGFWGGVGDVLGVIGQAISNLADWLVTALGVIVTGLILVAMTIVAVVLYALVLGADIQIDPDVMVDGIIGASFLLTQGLNIFLMAAVLSEGTTETPDLDYVGMVPVQDSDPENGRPYGPYERALLQARDLDAQGQASETVIDIVQVGVGDDGKPIWRVTVPSTQDWEGYGFGAGFGDAGAANDLGSNLALMLAPDQKAAFERMVIDAMTRAGIGPDDPVMMTGWSQGGILAGKMASDPTTPFNIEAIAVAGAPIDAMDIPEDVSVVAFQHENDPIHRLDGQAPPPNTDRWVTIESDPYGAPDDGWQGPFGADQHSSERYAQTAAAMQDGTLSSDGYIDSATQSRYATVSEMQEKFFSEDEVAFRYKGSE